jgi:hypothetical protein
MKVGNEDGKAAGISSDTDGAATSGPTGVCLQPDTGWYPPAIGKNSE